MFAVGPNVKPVKLKSEATRNDWVLLSKTVSALKQMGHSFNRGGMKMSTKRYKVWKINRFIRSDVLEPPIPLD